jgi:probable HAF family extracellular repeat protein
MTDDVGTYAPYAYIVSHGTCRFLGRAVVRAVRGRYAAGVRGFVNGHLAATNVPGQRFTAVRWVDTRMSELGDGFPFAINANGLTVGASRRPGPVNEVRGGSIEMQPTELEALAWDPAGRRIALVDRASSSIAYDVADDGTIVGTLTAQDGKHYAFRYRDGKLERLDDMPHPEGWRFESAYAIANDGSILGIGTRNGIATIFRWYATGGPT